MADEAQLIGWIKCDCCGTRVLELIVSPKYPNGAVRIVARHGKPHETIFDPSLLTLENIPIKVK